MSETTMLPIDGENGKHRKLKSLPQRPYTYIRADTHMEVHAIYEAHNKITLFLDLFWLDAITRIPRRDSQRMPWYPNPLNPLAKKKIKRLQSLQTPRVMPCDLEVRESQPLGFRVTPIRPLLPQHMRALINTFCHPSIRETMLNNPDLYQASLHVHLGELSPPGESKSTELCRPVYFDQHLRGARRDMEIRAKQMGAALAIIHCKCEYDGAGIKFQLGLRPNRDHVVMWPTNFARCRTFVVSQNLELKLALAIARNPTWPRPPGMVGFMREDSPLAPEGRRVWDAFKDAYLSACSDLSITQPILKFSPAAVIEHMSNIYNPHARWYDDLFEREKSSQALARILRLMDSIRALHRTI